MGLEGLLGSRTGEAAAFATAVCWSVTPFFFTAASRRVGSFPVNVIRLAMASLLLAVAVFVTGSAASVPTRQAAFLAASGVVGLTLGDAALFQSLYILGPRRVSLLSALAPVIVALLAIPLLGESLSVFGIVGMALTLAGVAWVVLERVPAGEVHGSVTLGVVLGVLAAAGQAVGAMLAKAGLGSAHAGTVMGDLAAGAGTAPAVSPLLGTFLRMIAGTLAVFVWAAAARRLGAVGSALRDRRAVQLTAGGAFFGPFVGVWLSLVAFAATTETAVAQTIMSFSPVLVLLISRLVHREAASPRAWLGSLAAVAGVGVLAFRQELERLLGG